MDQQKQHEEIGKLLFLLGTLAMIRVERWRDQSKYWRVGVEWYDGDDYLFICEKPTLLEALNIVLEHKEEWMYQVPKIKTYGEK